MENQPNLPHSAMTFSEKTVLVQEIQALSPAQVQGLLGVLARVLPQVNFSQYAVDLDIDVLPVGL